MRTFPEAAGVARLGHLTLTTPDVGRMRDYYTDVMGLHVVHAGSRDVMLADRCGELALMLEAGDHAACPSLAFEAATPEALAAIAASLRAAGVAADLATDPHPGVVRALRFTDPKGTRIEIATPARPEQTHRAAVGVGVLKLGHVAFASPMTRALTDFYVDLLGFRVSDWVGDIFSFLRCGPDHHTVNFLAGEAVRLHHIAYELQDWAHLLRACDELGLRRIPLIWGPGRHRVGHNLFVYHRDPDDHVVELYAELDQMKSEALGCFEPRPWHEHRPQAPRVWSREEGLPLWGPPPTEDFRRGGEAHLQAR